MGLMEVFGKQYGEVWQRLSAGHKVLLILLLALTVGATVAVVRWGSEPDYKVLATDMAPSESAELAAAVEDAGIQTRISEDGTAVLVPSAKLSEARMAAAGKGLTGSTRLGFESFRDPKIGMTPFAERINYLAALQNELATTIASLDSVSHARVHLVVPERALFRSDQQNGSASVVVTTSAGRRLSGDQAAAIANLVASAADGIAPEDVTITDGRGNVIFGGSRDRAQMAAGDQFAYRQRMESYLADKAETMLAKVLGEGRSEVRVSAEVAFEDSKKTETTYDADNAVPVTERLESTKTTGSSTMVGGVVGASGAAGSPSGAPGQRGTPSSQESKTENIDTTYLVGESIKETVDRGATVTRITAAVFIDSVALQEAITGTSATGATPVTLADITQLIKDAIGIDENRGDSLRIVEASFRPATEETLVEEPGMPDWVMTTGQYFAVGALGLVLLFVAKRALKNIESAAPRRVIVPEVMGAEGQAGLPVGAGQGELMQREIAKFVDSSPEAAGRVLESWVMGED